MSPVTGIAMESLFERNQMFSRLVIVYYVLSNNTFYCSPIWNKIPDR